MSKEFEEIVLKKLDVLDERTQKMKIEMGDLKQEMKDINLRLGKLEIEVKDMDEVINYHNQSFTKFDYEINKNIDTLFDAFTTNKEKDSVHEKNIVSLNAKVFNHDIRISNLEDKLITT